MCGGGLQYAGDRNFGQLMAETKAMPGGTAALGSQHWNELMGGGSYGVNWDITANTSPGTFGWAKEPGYHPSNASGMVPNPRTGGMKPGLRGLASSAGPGQYGAGAGTETESPGEYNKTPAYGATAPQTAAAARPAAAAAAAPSYGSAAMPWTQMNDYAGGIFSSQKGFMPGGPLSARQTTGTGATGATPAAAAPAASGGGGGKAAPTTTPGQYASTPKTTSTAPSPSSTLGGAYGQSTALDQMSSQQPAASQPQRQVTNRLGGHGSGQMLGYGIPLETRLGQDIAMQRNGAAAWAQKYGYPAPDHIGYWGQDRNGNIAYNFWPGVFSNAGGGAIRA